MSGEAGHWLGVEGTPLAVGGAGGGEGLGLVFRACQAPTGVCAHHRLSLSDVFLSKFALSMVPSTVLYEVSHQ